MVACQILQFTWLLLLLLLRISESDSRAFQIVQLNMKEAESPGAPLDPLPLLAPSPLIMPFTNLTLPNLGSTSKYLNCYNLSGKCPLNFSNAENVLATTAIDCWSSLAPYLANAVCCPQLYAAITILIGQSSFSSGDLGVSPAHANHCLSDIAQILEARGSNNDLLNICSINPSELTQSSCPLARVSDIENALNISKILGSCEKIDPVKECRYKVCQSAIMDAAVKIASTNYSVEGVVGGDPVSRVRVAVVDDCRKIVLRWMVSRLDPARGNKVLRGISSCKINKVCPLVFPDLKKVTKECGDTISNKSACCDAMENYIKLLQVQSFVTNLQAFNCASTLAANLRKANVSSNVYNICGIKLKDFSLQDSGCLFPSLPFDVTYDQSSGIEFKCDLNDNVAAPWPSSYAYSPSPSSNISVSGTDLPPLPKAASDQSGELFSSLLMS
ncbi:hypothetical protein OSB04_006243 [Centaurea solstitialis]|uniref:SPARK domain-containing protein n=1 Tax=Centaurea solstitialis TaxID=347529 RepID=A0AA38U261_9ASTR|nr:hypothetical protein OSB04_006243 [Centaurea solstitialis]